ncbi:MAG: caspase family protein [Bacteroidota bacterium]
MYNLKTLFFVLCTFLLAFGSTVDAATLHAIIITDTDPRIGSTKDKVLIDDLVTQIGRIANMTVNKQVFDKANNEYLSAIQELNPGEDDVVWIYYSGHGRNSGDGWPQFTNGEYKYKLTSIRNMLSSKDARLNLVMYDCCNHGATMTADPGIRLTPAALDILFRSSRGTIVASGSSPGKYGHGSPQIGGFFTVSFIKALYEVSPADGNDLWKVVFEKAKTSTNAMCRRMSKPEQTPIYSLDGIAGDGSCDVPVQIAPEKENPNAVDPFQ